jgi:aerobic-type carbon monoxide dehydrogenase small subunit (CoxS/CutS family)
MMEALVQFTLNGRPVSLSNDDDRILLWVLRTDFALTGAKYGCGVGICGACAVIINGEPHRSCRMTLKDVAGARVMTIEGLTGALGGLHPLQQAFIDHGAFQCGYCTSGMIIDAYALLQETPHPSREAIVARMDHNLCRCGAHIRIVDAIEQAAKQGAGS